MPRYLLAAVVLMLVGGCATTPRFDTNQTALSVTPDQALAEMDRLEGTRVLWGGVIVAARNLEKTTQLEVLGYPLDDRQRPRTDAEAQRRFLAVHEGYLETADYAQGRRVTLTGPLTGIRRGEVGDAPYTYPVVRAEDIELWPEEKPGSEPRFHFGIGVIFGG
jgi:outer membrane lipoprotein